VILEREGIVLEEWQWEALDSELWVQLKRAAHEHTRSYVYFIQELEGQPVKIGVAADPLRRLASLQTGNPRTLTIDQLIVGGVSVEKRLHRLWGRKGACIRDEWFGNGYEGVILVLAKEIARRQLAVLERGIGLDRLLPKCVDDVLSRHTEVLKELQGRA